MSESIVKAFVDRIEGDIAVLLVGAEQREFNLPKRHLPRGAGEGSALILRIELDEDSTQESRDRITRLIEDLGRQSAE
jgi:hypothetical protein